MEDDKLALFGICLGLPEIKRQEVKRNFHSPSQRREAYLDLYATDHPCPNWSQVAEAFRYGADLSSQADMPLVSTYVQGKISAHMYMYGCSESQSHVPSTHMQDKVCLLHCPYFDNMPNALNGKKFVKYTMYAHC